MLSISVFNIPATMTYAPFKDDPVHDPVHGLSQQCKCNMEICQIGDEHKTDQTQSQ